MPPRHSLREKNKKLTDFFAQKPSVPSPSLPMSSSPTETTTSMARRGPVTRTSKAAQDRGPPTNRSTPMQTRSASTSVPSKRAHSPDNDPRKTSRPPSRPKSPRKPTKIFQPEMQAKRPTAVIYVTSPFRNFSASTPTSLQVPNSVLVASPTDSSKQVVCSSQSDETELALPTPEPRDPGKVAESIHTWRRKASEFSHFPPRAREDAMEVDTPPSSSICGSPVVPATGASPQLDAPIRSTATHRSNTTLKTSVDASTCLPSPFDSGKLLPLPPTPEAMDSEAKTTRLIAEIRARAFATTGSSDDERWSLTYRELEDSDDDELAGDLPLIGNTKRQSSRNPAPQAVGDVFSSPLSSAPSTFNDSVTGGTRRNPDPRSPTLRHTRTSARIRKPAAAFRLPTTIIESSKSISETKPRPLPQNRKKSQAINPLQALLHEKELENKRGMGCTALRLAEEAIKGSREESIDSDDELAATGRLRLSDEEAAWKAVHESRRLTSPGSLSSTEEFSVGDRESRMLGTVTGEAINKILASDKDGKGKAKAQNANGQTSSGVPLWIQSLDEDMEVDPAPIPPLSGHPIFTCLDDFLNNHDDSLLDMILRSGGLVAVPRDILLSNVPQLLDMALFGSSQVAEGVSVTFRDLWELIPQKTQVPFAAILFALVRLGASPSVLEGLGFVTEGARKNLVTHEAFVEALKRFLAFVRAAGLASAFSSDDIANVVLVLVIVGLDPSVVGELRAQLDITLDVICNSDAADRILQDIYEKVLSFARQLSPINKALLISFFASGCHRTRCIAQRLAYYLLVSTPETPNNQAPPLEPLVLLLSPNAGSCELFDVTHETTNYEELGHYIDILSVALLDIAPYIEEERTIMKSMQGSPNKSKKPPVPPLELLRRVLEVLQSKIVDTRAAHLDRSRAKAAMQRLTLRIYYNRMALMGVRPCRQESTLEAYFSPQRQ